MGDEAKFPSFLIWKYCKISQTVHLLNFWKILCVQSIFARYIFSIAIHILVYVECQRLQLLQTLNDDLLSHTEMNNCASDKDIMNIFIQSHNSKDPHCIHIYYNETEFIMESWDQTAYCLSRALLNQKGEQCQKAQQNLHSVQLNC